MAKRYPRLDTIMMVEKFILENSGKYKRKELWENLPKKMMYQTYKLILDYLEYSGKIKMMNNKKVKWIFYPKNR